MSTLKHAKDKRWSAAGSNIDPGRKSSRRLHTAQFILSVDHHPFFGETTVTFESYHPTVAASRDAQFGHVAPEMPTPLVNLAVDRLPQAGQNENPVVASMLLARMNGEKSEAASAGEGFVQPAADKRNFEDALKTEFPEKYKMLKDNAENLRLELCLPANASLEQIAKQLYKLRQGEISRYSCRQA